MKNRTFAVLVAAVAGVLATGAWVRSCQRAEVEAEARRAAVQDSLNEQLVWSAERRRLESARTSARLAAESADRDHERWRSFESERAARAAWSAYIQADSALREHERKKIPPPTYPEWNK